MGKGFLEAAWRPRGAPLSYLAKTGMKGKERKKQAGLVKYFIYVQL